MWRDEVRQMRKRQKTNTSSGHGRCARSKARTRHPHSKNGWVRSPSPALLGTVESDLGQFASVYRSDQDRSR